MRNQKGISLIALIITIIVIIILAAIVIGSIQNAPDQANFAKYCQDYSEIQSAVSTQAAILYSDKILDTDNPTTASAYTITNAYKDLCGGESPTVVKIGTEDYVKIIDAQKSEIGLSSLPNYVDWYVNVKTGTLVSTNFSYDNHIYNNPTGQVTDAPAKS